MSVASHRVSLRHDVSQTDPDWVLEDEQVPESAAQDDASRTMDSVWRAWARRSGRVVCIHRNLAVRWSPQDPRIGVDPDLALIEPPPPPGESLTSLRTWEPGHHPPRVTLEVVSASHPGKDYLLSPRKHAAAGVEELWVFDPLRLGAEGEKPWLIQVWRRAPDGGFDRVHAGDGPAWSEAFGAWLVAPADGRLLRLSDDREGRGLWPTEAEEAERERAAKERERAAKERERAAKERALAEREREREAKERALADWEQERDAKERALADWEQERDAKERALARLAELEARLAAERDG